MRFSQLDEIFETCWYFWSFPNCWCIPFRLSWHVEIRDNCQDLSRLLRLVQIFENCFYFWSFPNCWCIPFRLSWHVEIRDNCQDLSRLLRLVQIFENCCYFWSFLDCWYITVETFFDLSRYWPKPRDNCQDLSGLLRLVEIFQDIDQDQMILVETCWDLVRLLRPSETFLTCWDSDWDHEVTYSDFQDLWVSWQLGQYFWLRVSTKICQESWSQLRDHVQKVLVLTTSTPVDTLLIVEAYFQHSLNLNLDCFQLTRPPCLKYT